MDYNHSIIMDRPTTPQSQMANNNQMKPPNTSYRTLVTQLPSVYENDKCSTVNIAANKIVQRNFKSEQQPNRISSRFNSRLQSHDGRDNTLDSVHKLKQSGLMNRLKINYGTLKLSQYKPTLQPLPPRKSEEPPKLQSHPEQPKEISEQQQKVSQKPPQQYQPRDPEQNQHDLQDHQPKEKSQLQQPLIEIKQSHQHPPPQAQHSIPSHQNELVQPDPQKQKQQLHHHHQQPLAPSVATRTTQVDISNKPQQLARATSEPNIRYRVQVNKRTYQILRKIGCGGSSKVYEGFDPQTVQTVAIKIINMALADPKAQESYYNERLLLHKLRKCNRVVRMYDSEYKSESKELILVMEKGDADLAQVIESYFEDQEDRLAIDYEFIKFHWKGILRSVNEIHRNGVVHSDLKPVNFIVVKNKLKLIDFGIANSIEPDHTSVIRDYQIGTINYMAPEALKNRASEIQHSTGQKTLIKYNAKADIWSLGCILYNMVYGHPPFDKYPNLISKAQAILDPNHKIEYTTISNSDLLDCMKTHSGRTSEVPQYIRAVELTADKLGAKLTKKKVDLFKAEHMKEDFIKINPLHCVPTIVDDGFIMWKSRAIMCYLVNKHSAKDDSLYPKDPKKRAIVDQMLYFDMGSLYAAQYNLLEGFMRGETELDPDKEKKFKDALKYLNSLVNSRSFAAGDTLTLADISIIATLSFSEVCDYDLSEFKALNSYRNRVKKGLPTYEKVSNDAIQRCRDHIKSKISA